MPELSCGRKHRTKRLLAGKMKKRLRGERPLKAKAEASELEKRLASHYIVVLEQVLLQDRRRPALLKQL